LTFIDFTKTVSDAKRAAGVDSAAGQTRRIHQAGKVNQVNFHYQLSIL
jgi:hypothetical protein